MSTKGITEADKHADAKTYYADIFHLPHWEPSSKTPTGRLKHPRMPMEKRAAIFASFDALSGYKDATLETARTTDERIELSEGEKEKLDQRLAFLIDRMEEGTDNGMLPGNIISADKHTDANNHTEGSPAIPPVSITYFSPDAKKDGGEYRSLTGIVKKIDLYERIILFDGGQSGGGQIIKLDDIIDLSGEMFTGLEGY